MAIDVERLTQLINKLDQIIQKNSYAGYDPFDGLRSALLKIVPLPGVYPKIAWIQFFKKFPINLRPLFLIAKGINPKAMGLFLSGYSSLYKIHKDNHDLEKAQFITNWLIKNQAPGYSGACWGYNFDWQNRAFFIPKNTPTIVGSAFIGHALLDFYEITGEQGPLATAQSITEFMRHDFFLSQMENDT
ncbi:MAG: delta-aminolevulinic acid dehydratase, partial [Calditrichaeota bacterium]